VGEDRAGEDREQGDTAEDQEQVLADLAAATVMIERSIPTRTVPSWPARTRHAMSMIC